MVSACWFFWNSFWRRQVKAENEVQNEMWSLTAGRLRKWRWRQEVENLYSYFSPSITAGLSDPAPSALPQSSFPGPPPCSLMLSFTHSFPRVFQSPRKCVRHFLVVKKHSVDQPQQTSSLNCKVLYQSAQQSKERKNRHVVRGKVQDLSASWNNIKTKS